MCVQFLPPPPRKPQGNQPHTPADSRRKETKDKTRDSSIWRTLQNVRKCATLQGIHTSVHTVSCEAQRNQVQCSDEVATTCTGFVSTAGTTHSYGTTHFKEGVLGSRGQMVTIFQLKFDFRFFPYLVQACSRIQKSSQLGKVHFCLLLLENTCNSYRSPQIRFVVTGDFVWGSETKKGPKFL